MSKKHESDSTFPEETLPVMALRGITVFPEMIINFDVERAASIAALNAAAKGERRIFLVKDFKPQNAKAKTRLPDLRKLRSIQLAVGIRLKTPDERRADFLLAKALICMLAKSPRSDYSKKLLFFLEYLCGILRKGIITLEGVQLHGC